MHNILQVYYSSFYFLFATRFILPGGAWNFTKGPWRKVLGGPVGSGGDACGDPLRTLVEGTAWSYRTGPCGETVGQVQMRAVKAAYMGESPYRSCGRVVPM